MRLLHLMLPVFGIAMAITPTKADRYSPGYPVCMQKWEWGGASNLDCSFMRWEDCKAAAQGLPAMCLTNPYAAGANEPSSAPYPRRGRY